MAKLTHEELYTLYLEEAQHVAMTCGYYISFDEWLAERRNNGDPC